MCSAVSYHLSIQCDTSHNAESHGWKLHAIHTSFFLVPNNATNDKVISSFSVIIARGQKERDMIIFIYSSAHIHLLVYYRNCIAASNGRTLCVYIYYSVCVL